MLSLAGKRVWVAGHHGMMGRALVRRLAKEDCEILTIDRQALDLRWQSDVQSWLISQRPDLVFLAAAKVGGILANSTHPAHFIYDNLAIQTNVIHASYQTGVGKLVFLGSSCMYPRLAAQPISEESMLMGPLEETNQWYAVAKIAGMKLCEAYRRQYGWDAISLIPTNLYGPYDNFDLQNSHVLPAIIRRLHEAKVQGHRTVELWGSGTPRREFLYVDDCADACVFLAKTYSDTRPINVGVGDDVSIRELAGIIGEVVGYDGALTFDSSMPDGTPRKLLDVSRLWEAGWRPRVPLSEGVASTYEWFLRNVAAADTAIG